MSEGEELGFEEFLDRISVASMIGDRALFESLRTDYTRDAALRQRVYAGLGSYLGQHVSESVLEDSTGVVRVASELAHVFGGFHQARLHDVVLETIAALSDDDRATVHRLLRDHIEDEEDPREQKKLFKLLKPYLE